MANLPPTPAPSTDIAGKPTTLSAHLDAIALPPAAIVGGRASVSSSSTNDAASDSSYRPISPSSPEARQKAQLEKTQSAASSRKRSSDKAELGPNVNDNYALPPPPTRSRKIIQMKPQTGKGKSDGGHQQPSPAILSQSPLKGTAATSPTQYPQGSSGQAQQGNGKKKQANSSTAAGRKIARKTAHSLIERRRRSKMNEEFGVLKDMIPACAGQDMHKLAILQASIEYMRYLESCVAELKAANKSKGDAVMLNPPSYTASTARTTPNDGDLEDDEDEDAEMTDGPSTHATNTPQEHPLDRRFTDSTAGHSRPSISPAILPSATTSPLFTRPSMSSNQSFSNLPSPAFYAQQQQHPPRLPSLSLTSPVLQAQLSGSPSVSGQEMRQLPPVASITSASQVSQPAADDEQTASALLMLTNDRRSYTGRGMSVKDLLSSQ